MEEVWKTVKGFDGKYEVSNFGRVRSLDRIARCGSGFCRRKGVILKPILVVRGRKRKTIYRQVVLYNTQNDYRTVMVHVLVAEAFLDNPENKPCVDHINGAEYGDAVWNLRWCTQKENSGYNLARLHASEAKRGKNHPRYGKYGADNPCSKPVMRYSTKNEFIEKYDSVTTASRVTGVNLGHIAACCRGLQKSAGGYIWKYANENKNG